MQKTEEKAAAGSGGGGGGVSLWGAIKSVGRAVDPTYSGSIVRKAGRAVDPTSSSSVVRRVGRAVDITSSRNPIGKILPSGVRGAIRTVAQTAAAPVVVPTAIAVKGTTYVASKVGLPGAKQLDKAVGGAYRSPVVKAVRDNYKTQLEIGAAVGAARLGGQVLGGAVRTAIAAADPGSSSNAPAGASTGPAVGGPAAASAEEAAGGSDLLRELLALAFPGLVE